MRKTLKRNLAYDDRNHLYYVSLYYDGENGRRVRRTRTYQTMEQAEQVIADYRRAQLLGGKSAPRDVSMEDWLRYWMREIITPNCAETTRHGYENILYTHMIPTLGKVHAQELTAMRVQQYYGELRKKGLANNTIRKHHVLLHAALGAAVRQGIVRDNVADLVTPPAHEAPRHRFYDSSQLRKLFCASEGSQLEIAVKLAGCLGLRRSEICGLKWRNVDLERGVLTICEVRTAVSGRALEKAPKSYASERRLAFRGSEDLEALLHRLHREWEQRRLRILYDLSAGRIPVLVTTLEALQLRTIPKSTLYAASIRLTAGGSVHRSAVRRADGAQKGLKFLLCHGSSR